MGVNMPKTITKSARTTNILDMAGTFDSMQFLSN